MFYQERHIYGQLSVKHSHQISVTLYQETGVELLNIIRLQTFKIYRAQSQIFGKNPNKPKDNKKIKKR